MNTNALRKIYQTHPLVMEAAAEIERLRAERDEWKAKWMSLAQASLIAGTMTLEQKADTE